MKTKVEWVEIDEQTVAIVTTVTYDKEELYNLLMRHLPMQQVGITEKEAKLIQQQMSDNEK